MADFGTAKARVPRSKFGAWFGASHLAAIPGGIVMGAGSVALIGCIIALADGLTEERNFRQQLT